jgi:hypothetical protein
VAQKKQMNLFLEEDLQERIRQAAREMRYDGPSELIRRDVLGYLDGDLDALTRQLLYALTHANTAVDQQKLRALKVVVDGFVIGQR